jgi:hypothetical protein
LAEAFPEYDYDSNTEPFFNGPSGESLGGGSTGFYCVYGPEFEIDGESYEGVTLVESCPADQAKFICEAKAGILALIAENERIDGCCKEMAADMGKLTRERNSFRSSAEKLKAENEALRQSVADHKACIASDNELFREVSLECNRYHSVIVAVGELLGISKEEQDEKEATQEELIEAVNELWGQVHGMQEDLDQYKSEHEVLRQVLVSSHEFILNDARTRHMCDETGQVSPLFPKRVGILAAIDAAMGKGEQS